MKSIDVRYKIRGIRRDVLLTVGRGMPVRLEQVAVISGHILLLLLLRHMTIRMIVGVTCRVGLILMEVELRTRWLLMLLL